MSESRTSSAKIAVMTINQHEEAAVKAAMRKEFGNNQPPPRDGSVGKYSYTVTSYIRPGLDVDHIACCNSGNLPTALITYQHFRSDAVYNAVILYGCAGLNPMRVGSGLQVGDSVLVQRVDYYENGDVRTMLDSNGRMGDYVLAKLEKFYMNRIELSGDHLSELTSSSLSKRTALCGDKILKIDMAAEVPSPETKSQNLATYRELLMMDYDIIEMESSGFLSALGDQMRANAIVIRVITDQLSDHPAAEKSEKATGGANQGDDQRKLLVAAAEEVLLPAIKHLESVLTGPPPARSPTRPPAKTKPSAPNKAASRPRPRAARTTSDAPTKSKQMLERTLRDSLTPMSAEELARQLAVAAATLVKTQPTALEHESHESRQLVYDLADFHRFGYGTLRLASRGTLEIPTLLQDSMRRILPASQKDVETRRRWNEIFSTYDPTRSQQAYVAAARTAMLSQEPAAVTEPLPLANHIGVIVSSPKKRLILTPKRFLTNLTAILSRQETIDSNLPSEIVAWNGFESDRKLASALAE